MPTHAAPDAPPASAAERRTLRITVLAGGPSAEREVSLLSGAAIADALRRRGHDVLLADARPGQLAALDQPADVIFSALHGTFGEDGQLQRILEQRRLPFVGSDAVASALAIDKVRTKQLVLQQGVDTPEFVVLDRTSPAHAAAPLLSGPVVVKPIDQGSSVLTSVVRRREDFAAAAQAVISEFGRALVERFIPGDELTVGVLAGQALPPICIRTARGFYDYQAKYIDDNTQYLFDGGHSPQARERAMRLSERVFAQVGCRHLARIDWMIDPQERLWFLEVNTLPGFTSHSLLPKAAAHVGIPFDALCERLVRMAFSEGAAGAGGSA